MPAHLDCAYNLFIYNGLLHHPALRSAQPAANCVLIAPYHAMHCHTLSAPTMLTHPRLKSATSAPHAAMGEKQRTVVSDRHTTNNVHPDRTHAKR